MSESEWRRVFKKGKKERINQTGEGERVVADVLKGNQERKMRDRKRAATSVLKKRFK